MQLMSSQLRPNTRLCGAWSRRLCLPVRNASVSSTTTTTTTTTNNKLVGRPPRLWMSAIETSSSVGTMLMTRSSLSSSRQRQTPPLPSQLPRAGQPHRIGFVPQRTSFSSLSYPPHQVVGLPSLSPTMESGSIANWNLKEGDSFAAGDVFCSVETDKATVDFEAQDDGVLAKILVPAGAGSEIKIGHPIMITVDDTSHVSAFANYVADTAAVPPAAAVAPSSPPAQSTEALSLASVIAPTPVPATATATSNSSDDRVVASPRAHMLAKELGYTLHGITGTGPGGRILAADVQEYVPPMVSATTTATDLPTLPPPIPTAGAPTAAAMATAAVPTPAPIAGVGYTDYPLSVQARDAATRLMQSKRNVPHYYLTVDIRCDNMLAMREQLQQHMGSGDSSQSLSSSSIGMYELFLKAAAIAMKTVPAANASWMGDVIRVYDSVDINVVLGSGDTYDAPVLIDVGHQGLRSLSHQLHTAMIQVHESKTELSTLPPSSSAVGTFTVINLGMYGIKSCAPIIREPQACALALGALEHRIIPNDHRVDNDDDDDTIYQEAVMVTATLSCDHRVVDGAVGAQWLAAFKQLVENPTTLLL